MDNLDDLSTLPIPENMSPPPMKTDTELHIEDLPREIISQILRFAIPTWSLRIDRRTRHACGQHIVDGSCSEDIRSHTMLNYSAKPSAPHDIRYLLHINKLISSLVRAEYLHTFSGILEIYHFVVEGEDERTHARLESSTTRDGCPCFTADERFVKLQAALEVYVNQITAIRLMDLDFHHLDLDLLRILDMSKITFIGCRPFMLRFFYSPPGATSPRVDSESEVSLADQILRRWSDNDAKPPAVPFSSKQMSYVATLWKSPLHVLAEFMVYECKDIKAWNQNTPYFLVGFVVRRDCERWTNLQILGRYEQGDAEMVELDVRLARYLRAFKALL